jgi:hypothetical protein
VPRCRKCRRRNDVRRCRAKCECRCVTATQQKTDGNPNRVWRHRRNTEGRETLSAAAATTYGDAGCAAWIVLARGDLQDARAPRRQARPEPYKTERVRTSAKTPRADATLPAKSAAGLPERQVPAKLTACQTDSTAKTADLPKRQGLACVRVLRAAPVCVRTHARARLRARVPARAGLARGRVRVARGY